MFQLDSVQRDPVVSSAVATTAMLRTQRQSMINDAQLSSLLPQLVLLDDSAHRALRFSSQSSGTWSDGGMILPGMSIIRRRTKVEARSSLAKTGSALAPARIMFLDWTSLGQAPLRVRAERE